MKFKIVSTPFSWNDNMSEDALETFEEIRHTLSYGACSSLGTALSKLKILEEQGAKVDELKLCQQEITKRIIVKSRYGTLGFSVPADISEEELHSKRDSALEFLEGLYDRTSR